MNASCQHFHGLIMSTQPNPPSNLLPQTPPFLMPHFLLPFSWHSDFLVSFLLLLFSLLSSHAAALMCLKQITPHDLTSLFKWGVITLFCLIAWELLKFIPEASVLHPWTLRSMFLVVYSPSILSPLLSRTPLVFRHLFLWYMQTLWQIGQFTS